jgi:hypothetical protein
MKWMPMLQMYWPEHVLSPPNPIPLGNPVTIALLRTWFFMLCETTSCYYNFVTCHGIPILTVLSSVEWFFGNLGNNWWFWFWLYTPSPDLNLSLFKYLNFNQTLGPALILDPGSTPKLDDCWFHKFWWSHIGSCFPKFQGFGSISRF